MIQKSLNYWSAPGGLEGTMSPKDFILLAKKHRFPAVELAIGDLGSALSIDATEAECKEILEFANNENIAIPSTASGLYWSRSIGDSDESNRSQATKDLEKMLRISSWLGSKTLLVIPGAVDVFFMPERKPQPYAEVWQNSTRILANFVTLAEQLNVRIGIENVWNKFLNSPQEMAQYVDQFSSPFVGAYVDVANLQLTGYAEDWIRHLSHRVVGVHFKDFRKSIGNLDGFVDLLEGDVNWVEVMSALQEIRYQGPVCAELIPCYKHFPEVRIQNCSNAMDAILGLSQ